MAEVDHGLPVVLFENDVAAVLRCHVRTVQRIANSGKLPPHLNIPGRKRWSRDVILDWISSGDVPRGGRRRR